MYYWSLCIYCWSRQMPDSRENPPRFVRHTPKVFFIGRTTNRVGRCTTKKKNQQYLHYNHNNKKNNNNNFTSITSFHLHWDNAPTALVRQIISVFQVDTFVNLIFGFYKDFWFSWCLKRLQDVGSKFSLI